VEASVKPGLERFKREFLDNPEWYDALCNHIGASPNSWDTSVPQVIGVCFGDEDTVKAAPPILHDLAQLTATIATKTRMTFNAPKAARTHENSSMN
jgi:hypothetical protein